MDSTVDILVIFCFDFFIHLSIAYTSNLSYY